jgi:hypothetical protein
MSADKVKIHLKKIKDSTHILHPDSNLVLKSAKDKTVIGRYEENTIAPMNDDDLELCTKWNFKYDRSFLQPEDVDEDEEDREEEEEEEEGKEQEAEAEEEVRNEEKELPTTQVTVQEAKLPSKIDCVLISSGQLQSQVHFSYYSSELNKLHTSLLDNLNTVESDNLKKIKELQTSLENKNSELELLQAEFNKLKTKFDNIKSLFS